MQVQGIMQQNVAIADPNMTIRDVAYQMPVGEQARTAERPEGGCHGIQLDEPCVSQWRTHTV